MFPPPCGEATVCVDQAEHARGVVRDRVQERALALLLDLETATLGDLDPRHEHERLGASGHVRDRHGGPQEGAHAPVGAAQLGLDLLRRAARGGRRDRGLRTPVVVDDEVQEVRADELVVAPAERLPERTVRSDAGVVDVAVADRAVAIEHDGDARDRLEGRRRRVALALELELALSALGDVEAARDDAHDPAGRVLHRRRAPVDRADLAARVRERVLVLARRVVGSESVEARDHAVALARLDEEVPEVLPARELLVRRGRTPRARRR